MRIEALAYDSRLADFSPRAKIVSGLLPLTLALGWNSFSVSLAVTLLMSGLTLRFGRLSLGEYLRLITIPLGFVIISAISIAVSLFPLAISPESLRLAASVALRALAALCCLFFISLNTPMNDMLAALRSWKIPALFAALMELIYRYVFVFIEEAARIRVAQEARGGYGNLRSTLRCIGQLVAALFLRVYIRCDNIYNALASRGYTGEFKTSNRVYAPSQKIYFGACALSLGLCLLGVIEKKWVF